MSLSDKYLAKAWPSVTKLVTLGLVVRCMATKNVWSVERKPTGKDTTEIIKLTRLAQQRIIRRFKMVISKADSGKLERKKEAAEVLVEMLRGFG